MQLGAFSISLNVKDLKVSQAFYEKLGFSVFGGGHEHNYLIMKNGDAMVGLFQGMFEKNILTFNPGWDQEAQTLDDYDDVRSIHARIKEAGLEPRSGPEGETGPGSITLVDPDGNPILIDQHV